MNRPIPPPPANPTNTMATRTTTTASTAKWKLRCKARQRNGIAKATLVGSGLYGAPKARWNQRLAAEVRCELGLIEVELIVHLRAVCTAVVIVVVVVGNVVA